MGLNGTNDNDISTSMKHTFNNNHYGGLLSKLGHPFMSNITEKLVIFLVIHNIIFYSAVKIVRNYNFFVSYKTILVHYNDFKKAYAISTQTQCRVRRLNFKIMSTQKFKFYTNSTTIYCCFKITEKCRHITFSQPFLGRFRVFIV